MLTSDRVCVCMYVCMYVCRRRVKETVKRSNGKIPLSFGNIVYVCMYVCMYVFLTNLFFVRPNLSSHPVCMYL